MAVDGDPNVGATAPAEGRKLANRRTGGLGVVLSMYCVAFGGTSIDIQIWMLTQSGTWVELSGGPVTCLEGQLTILSDNLPASAQFFAQIDTNTGVERIELGFTSDLDGSPG